MTRAFLCSFNYNREQVGLISLLTLLDGLVTHSIAENTNNRVHQQTLKANFVATSILGTYGIVVQNVTVKVRFLEGMVQLSWNWWNPRQIGPNGYTLYDIYGVGKNENLTDGDECVICMSEDSVCILFRKFNSETIFWLSPPPRQRLCFLADTCVCVPNVPTSSEVKPRNAPSAGQGYAICWCHHNTPNKGFFKEERKGRYGAGQSRTHSRAFACHSPRRL